MRFKRDTQGDMVYVYRDHPKYDHEQGFAFLLFEDPKAVTIECVEKADIIDGGWVNVELYPEVPPRVFTAVQEFLKPFYPDQTLHPIIEEKT